MLGQPNHWTPVFPSMTSLETLPNVSDMTTAVWATWRWGARRGGCTLLPLEKQPLLWRYAVCTFKPYWIYLGYNKNISAFSTIAHHWDGTGKSRFMEPKSTLYGKRGPVYVAQAISLLLMIWQRQRPGQQQLCYWSSSPEIFGFSSTRVLLVP